jgi:hydrogenase/urease accessory protein HupE
VPVAGLRIQQRLKTTQVVSMEASAPPIKSWFGICLSALFLTLFAPNARAHDPGLSTVTITIREQQVDALLGFNQKDAEALLESLTPNPSIEKIGSIDDALAATASKELELYLDDRLTAPSQAIARLAGNQNVEVLLRFKREKATSLRGVSTLIGKLPFGHREFLSVRTDHGATLEEAMLSAQRNTFQINLPREVDRMDTADKETGLQGRHSIGPPITAVSGRSFIAFLGLGVEHILTGYDHLLFLFALLVVCRNLRSILTVISCFTVAHSITLALAVLEIVRLPGRIVEPLIAASIAYVGVENLVQGGSPRWRWLITLSFGLIHGLGFADALREFGIGSPGPGIVLPLVGFNLGVEIGQLSVAAIILPTLWCLRKHPAIMHRLVPVCSMSIVVAGSYWMIERIFAP